MLIDVDGRGGSTQGDGKFTSGRPEVVAPAMSRTSVTAAVAVINGNIKIRGTEAVQTPHVDEAVAQVLLILRRREAPRRRVEQQPERVAPTFIRSAG